MSEAQKPVEEPVVAPAAATAAPVETAPADESKPVETAAPVAETPAAVEPAKEEAAPAKEEVKPVEEGTLGYKGPGLIKGFMFQKKFFWFGSEPVEHKHLSSYLRGEKPEVANHNAAWASNTGKGLLFFSKKASEKASPSHVFNLSDISDISEEGTVDFFFNQGGHKYTFQASSISERDNWVAVLKTKATEAKEIADSVKESEEYKKTHSSLTKPVFTPAATVPKKSTEVKKEDKAEAKEEKKEEKAEAKEEKKEEKKEAKEEKKEDKSRKSRSASRKRTSIFGSIRFGDKKEEKADAKEETPVAPTETPAAATTEPAAPAEAAPATEATPAPVEPAAPAAEPRPTPNKRNSIFDSLKSQFSHKEKKPEAEAAPAVPAKDAEPVSETAPVIPAVESSEPLATSVASPATVPTETSTAPATNGEGKTETTPAVKSDKRKSSLPWLNSSKKEKATGDEEGEKKPTSPFAKLRATVKGKSSPKAEKAPEPAAEAAKKEDETPAATESAKTEPASVAATTPQVAATA